MNNRQTTKFIAYFPRRWLTEVLERCRLKDTFATDWTVRKRRKSVEFYVEPVEINVEVYDEISKTSFFFVPLQQQSRIVHFN